MKIFLLIILSVLTTKIGYSQTDKSSNHVGVSGLPIFDILNSFPKNSISGGAINANYGTFIGEKLSFGLNFYFANASNTYPTDALDSHDEKQNIALTGLNSNLRFNHFLTKRLLVFGLISFGFGNNKLETTNLSTNLKTESKNESIAMIITGLGVGYFVTKQIAIELNIPYIFMNRFSTDPNAENFHTIAPMIGIQYYWDN